MLVVISFLGFFALGVLGFFVIRTKLQSRSSAKASRISTVYGELITLLVRDEKNIRLNASTRTLRLQFNRNSEQHSYHFSEVDNRLIVVWTLVSKVHGKRGKEWSFNASFDQKRMFGEIAEDLGGVAKLLHREN